MDRVDGPRRLHHRLQRPRLRVLARTAWDFVGSAFGSRNELYERNYLASTKTNRFAQQTFYSAANKARGKELLDKVLAGTRARR